jgi:hypothetical protein
MVLIDPDGTRAFLDKNLVEGEGFLYIKTNITNFLHFTSVPLIRTLTLGK